MLHEILNKIAQISVIYIEEGINPNYICVINVGIIKSVKLCITTRTDAEDAFYKYCPKKS